MVQHPANKARTVGQTMPPAYRIFESLTTTRAMGKTSFEGADKCLTVAGHITEKDKARINWLNLRTKNELVIYLDRSQQVHPNGKVLGTGLAWVIQ